MTDPQHKGGWTPGPDGVDDLSAAKVDFFYNPEDWECTHDISDQWAVEEWLQDVDVIVVSTLIRGPQVYAASIPIDLDEDGEPDDWETRYFATPEDARAALAKASPDKSGGA